MQNRAQFYSLYLIRTSRSLAGKKPKKTEATKMDGASDQRRLVPRFQLFDGGDTIDLGVLEQLWLLV